MLDLVSVLGTPSGFEMSLITARVEDIPVGGPARLDLVVGDLGDEDCARIINAGYLASYTPVVGDIVCVIVKSNVGALVLGKLAGSDDT